MTTNSNPYTPLAERDDHDSDDPTQNDPPLLSTNDNPNLVVPPPIRHEPTLVILTTFPVSNEKKNMTLRRSIEFQDIVDIDDNTILRDDTYEALKLHSLHSIMDHEQCDDATVQRFQEQLNSNLFKISGYIDTSSPKKKPIPNHIQGLQRFYTDTIQYYGFAEDITEVTIELEFRLRVTPSAPIMTPVHRIHDPNFTRSTTTIQSTQPPMRQPNHRTSSPAQVNPSFTSAISTQTCHPNVSSPSMNTPDSSTPFSMHGSIDATKYFHQLSKHTYDQKGFLKEKNIPKLKDLPLSLWYKQFVSFGLRHGVFIPPYESLHRSDIMGLYYQYAPDSVKELKDTMTGDILTALYHYDIFTDPAILNDIGSGDCGYYALFNLLRHVHPHLMENPTRHRAPECTNTNKINEYIIAWKHFLIQEQVNNRAWSAMEYTHQIIIGLPEATVFWVMNEFRYSQQRESVSEVPSNFYMGTLAQTLTLIIARIPNSVYNRNQGHQGHHAVRLLTDGSTHTDTSDESPDFNADDVIDIIRAVQGHSSTSKKCALCNSESHELLDCFKYIDYNLCVQLQKSHPTLAAKILAKHSHSPRFQRSRTSALTSTSQTKSHNKSNVRLLQQRDSSDSDDSDSEPDNSTDETGVIHCIQAPTTDLSNMEPPNTDTSPLDLSEHMLKIPDDLDDINDTIRSINFDLPLVSSDNALDDIRSQNEYGINDFSFPEDPIHELFTEQPSCCLPCNVNVTTANAHSPHDGINDPIAPKNPSLSVSAQIDSGANTNTTNQASILWNIHRLSKPKRMYDAGQTEHIAKYRGFIVLQDNDNSYKAIATYYTPTIHATILSPNAICKQYTTVKQCTFTFDIETSQGTMIFKNNTNASVFSISFGLHNGLQWTQPVIRPTSQQKRQTLPRNIVRSITISDDANMDHEFFDDNDYQDIQQFLSTSNDISTDTESESEINQSGTIHQLNLKTQSQLYHQRLGHLNFRSMSTLYQHVDGIPKLPTPNEIDNCPVCLAAKLRKSNAANTETHEATECFQSIAIDMGFIVQQSKNTKRFKDYVGINGETCYILITDQFSGMNFGKPLVTKTVPIEWLNNWLARYSPNIPNKTVRMDQGHELGRSKRVVKILQQYGYHVELTGADASHQNGLVERSHQTIGNMIRSLLIGSNVSKKLWPYALNHCFFIMNRVLHEGKTAPPISLCSGQRCSIKGIRTFGCRVYVKLPGNRPAKLDTHHRTGIFLGYANTMRNIFWYDSETNRVKIATHFRFDEGMTDLPEPTPNIKILQRHDENLPVHIDDIDLPDLDFSIEPTPFRELDTIQVTVTCEHPSVGIEIGECHIRGRAYVRSIVPNTSVSAIRNFKRKYVGAFIVEVNKCPVFDVEDATKAFHDVLADVSIPSFDIVLAPEKYVPVQDRRDYMALDINQIRNISSLCYPHTSSDNTIMSSEVRSVLDSSIVPVPISPDELALNGSFTRKKLKRLSTWPLWLDSEKQQLDKMHNQEMFGPPCIPPPKSIILNQIWRYYFKNGVRKSRECCDGSPRAAPYLHQVAVTYASCIEQPISRLFYALCAYYNLIILTTDAVNAFANADAPSIPTYVRIDDAYAEWYFNKFGITVDRSHCLPAQHALQGHPESPRLWEEYINRILKDKLNLVPTTHERSIYSGLFKGYRILLKRQVDDIAIAAPTKEIAEEIIQIIGKSVHIEGNDLLIKFNGVEVEQSREYIRIHCSKYISNVLTKHGWDTILQDDHSLKEPIPATMFKQIDLDQGPPEKTPEAIALEKQFGFSYRSLLGELMYSYVICRLDIGYILTKLSQFSQAPAAIHYSCLKRITLYLRETKEWGIVYWRPNHFDVLPVGTFQPIEVNDPTLPPFPSSADPLQLVGYVDASHATDIKTRRSITGFILTLCGGAICYRSKVQTSVATSSTESEFVAAVTASKAVLYLRSVMKQLGCEQLTPTPMYEDNEAAIMMINASKPTVRARHIDIQHFAIQEWKLRGDIIFFHIPGVINMSDAMTKAVGWILHVRHNRRAMGHHLPVYVVVSYSTVL